DAAGDYRFDDLAPGTYHVRQVLVAGHRKTNPGPGVPGYDLTLAAGENQTEKDFGVTSNILLAGKVFDDIDSNGSQGADEPGIPGIVINIVSNDTIVASRTPDANGKWQVKGLSAGTGEAQAVIPDNFTPTSPADGKYAGSMSAGQQNANLNFGLHVTT